MTVFFITLQAVATLLLYAVPGYLLIRSRRLQPEHIHPLVVTLLYVNQTCMMLYSFSGVTYTPALLQRLGVTFLVAMGLMLLFFALAQAVLRPHYDQIPNRIFSIAVCIGNVGFFGIPLIEELMPEHPEALAYVVPFSVALNVFCWSLGAAVITGDRSYVSWKKALLNPVSIAAAVGLGLLISGISLPGMVSSAVNMLGRMATPMCLIILGMRLGAAGIGPVFRNRKVYFITMVKQVLMPLCVLGLVKLLQLEESWAFSLYLLSCCPCASMTLNFAELLHAGQDTAAHQVLMSTMAAVVTIPVMVLFWQWVK